ncbi:MAG: hypothetical protein ACK5DD_00185 [Cyclobacteriaceae bacterium]
MKQRAFLVRVAVVVVWIFTSCGSTHHTLLHQYIYAQNKSGVTLMLPVWGLPENESLRNFEELKKQYERHGMELNYLPSEEWNLAAQMVSLKGETFIHDLAKAGYSYLLDIRIDEQFSGSAFEYFTPFEVEQRVNTRFDYRNQVARDLEKRGEVFIQLVTTADQKIAYQAKSVTAIQPMAFPGRDDGETQVNLASSQSAISTAIRKGVNRMIDRCYE